MFRSMLMDLSEIRSFGITATHDGNMASAVQVGLSVRTVGSLAHNNSSKEVETNMRLTEEKS